MGVGCWASDVYRSLGLIKANETIFYALRTAIAFSFFYIGHLLAKKKTLDGFGIMASVVSLAISICLMVTEVYYMHVIYGADMTERQLPLFSLLTSLSLLSLCVNLRIKDNAISGLGRNYSLGIYLLHPFILYFILRFGNVEIVKNSSLKLLSGFIISILSLMLLKRFLPYIYNKLNGIGVK